MGGLRIWVSRAGCTLIGLILSANHTANWAGPDIGSELARRVDELPGPGQQLWGFLLLSRGSFIYPSHWDTGILVGATAPGLPGS